MARLMLSSTQANTQVGIDEYVTEKQSQESSLGDQIGDALQCRYWHWGLTTTIRPGEPEWKDKYECKDKIMIHGKWHVEGSAAQQGASLSAKDGLYELLTKDGHCYKGKIADLQISDRLGNVERNITLGRRVDICQPSQ